MNLLGSFSLPVVTDPESRKQHSRAALPCQGWRIFRCFYRKCRAARGDGASRLAPAEVGSSPDFDHRRDVRPHFMIG